ncbi:staphylopine uptake ABC transporter ATP-binding protein CntD [Saccharibacillus alkalitolerans]|uniref:ABC transporter ATP-binding protein n=1 Tax=Saccharibacillus alkalitolerans TaxID=2705290 RepID=A0ABX0F9V9_9BACL|nr:ABC transporter ATP-binding protein [Saccharibacillus alkalitolerans]NGZ77098.1 ABC transporter ATP-binding protein [Saccharibacillus alkalitolerans]
MNILEVEHLKVWEAGSGKSIVHESSFDVRAGRCLAIVGESGSGKSVTCRSIVRLNKSSLRQSGAIRFKGEDLNALPFKALRNKRGRQICMILQNGMSAFDPSCAVGVHLRETLKRHYGWGRGEIEARMISAMESVRLKNPLDVMNSYPYQLSGGMLQRVMIALALALEPDLVIADEPTTALDTLSQFEVVEQLIGLRERLGGSMIFVSHDLGVVRRIADDVLVMKNGEIVERGGVSSVFEQARHPYTQYLISTRSELGAGFKTLMKGGVSDAQR